MGTVEEGMLHKWNKAKEHHSLSVQPRASFVNFFEYILHISLCTFVDTALTFILIITTDLWLLWTLPISLVASCWLQGCSCSPCSVLGSWLYTLNHLTVMASVWLPPNTCSVHVLSYWRVLLPLFLMSGRKLSFECMLACLCFWKGFWLLWKERLSDL